MEEALQYTQLAVNIIFILLFIMLVVLVSMLIKSVKNITTKVEKLSDDVMSVKPKVETAIEKINSISENVNGLVTKVNDNIGVLATVVDKVKDTADNILDFERTVQSRIQPPVMNTVNTISAISVGVKTFFDKLVSSKKNKNILNENRLRNNFDFDDLTDDEDSELDEINMRVTDLNK